MKRARAESRAGAQVGALLTLRGFTLIEMIVALAIFGILTAVILSGQSIFNQTILLTDTAYTVALSIRESQTLGLSSEKALGIQSASIGDHFSNGSTNSYVQFADIMGNSSYGNQSGAATPPSWCPLGTAGTPTIKPGNCVYDGANELYNTYTFKQNFTESFCAYANNVSLGCSSAGSSPQLSSLDIVFQRPNTDTIITGTLTSGPYVQPDTACIEITAPNGSFRYVKVTQLGEIAVTQACP